MGWALLTKRETVREQVWVKIKVYRLWVHGEHKNFITLTIYDQSETSSQVVKDEDKDQFEKKFIKLQKNTFNFKDES